MIRCLFQVHRLRRRSSEHQVFGEDALQVQVLIMTVEGGGKGTSGIIRQPRLLCFLFDV